jgi:ribosomal protein S16
MVVAAPRCRCARSPANPSSSSAPAKKLDALEEFDPARIAGRILGMGDIVALVEKAAANIDAEKAMRTAEKMRKGAFDLGDLREQLTQMQGMGGLGGLMSMLPGIAKMKNQLAAANIDEGVIKRQIAIIDSMTPQERRNPDILKASRKKRIASGSGTTPEAINKLLKMHRGMSDMMKMMGGAKRGPLADLAKAMGLGAGMPSPEQLAEMAKKMPGGQLPPGMPGLPPTMPRCHQICPACLAWAESFPDCPAVCRPVLERRSDPVQLNRKDRRMSLVIRLARAGTKKRPVYHCRCRRQSCATRRPLHRAAGLFQSAAAERKTERLKLDLEKVQAWMKKGAQPSDRVMRFLDAAGIMKRPKRNNPEKASRARNARPRKKKRQRRPKQHLLPKAAPRRRHRRLRSLLRPRRRQADASLSRHASPCRPTFRATKSVSPVSVPRTEFAAR